MSLYTFPPRILNGTLYQSTGAEYVRGKIEQTLSVIRGELVADQEYGLPIQLFTSINDFSADVAKLESQLTSLIEEAIFLLSYVYLGKGQFSLTVNWEYQNDSNKAVFLIDTQAENGQ